MRALLLVAAVAASAEAKPKPLAATLACAAIDDAAQRRKLDDKQRTARPKVTHKIECAISSTDARMMDAKATGRASWSGGHVDVAGRPVGDVQVGKTMRRLQMIEFEADSWDRCADVDLDLSIQDGDGAAVWQHTIKTAGSCAKN